MIHSDSRSALTSITDPFSRHPFIAEIHLWLNLLKNQGKTVRFCWVPSHVGVAGNEAADAAATAAPLSNLAIPDRPLPCKDYYSLVKGLLKHRWAERWRDLQGNKLRNVKDSIVPWDTSCRKNRYEERLLCRLRIGHTRLTHEFLMSGDPIPFCENCLVPLSVHHILVECPDYVRERSAYWTTNGTTLKKILADNEESVQKVISFLKDIDLYHKT